MSGLSQSSLDNYLAKLRQHQKVADEMGSMGPASTHPSAKEDSGSRPTQTGEQFSDNTKLVKEQNGEAGIENTPELKPTSGPVGESVAPQIGIVQSATGEDPTVEDNFTNKPKDQQFGTTTEHPARVDTPKELNGEKYAAHLASLTLDQKLNLIPKSAHEILADITNACSAAMQPAAAPVAPSQKVAEAPAQMTTEQAHQGGWSMADLLLSGDKTACDRVAMQLMTYTVKTASEDADSVARLIHDYQRTQQGLNRKRAGEAPPADDAALMDAMGAGGGGEAPPAPGGDPMAPPPAGGGGDMGGMGGDMGGGGGGEGGGITAEEVAMILQEAGVSPEELEAALAQLSGGGEMGGDMGGGGDAGGGPPMAPPAAEPPVEKMASLRNPQRPQVAVHKKRATQMAQHLQEWSQRSKR